jgi:hypothetical protein
MSWPVRYPSSSREKLEGRESFAGSLHSMS